MENVSFSQSMMFRKSWDFMKKQGVTMVGLFSLYGRVCVFESYLGRECYFGALYLGEFIGCDIVLGIWNGVRQIDFEYS